MGFGACGCSMVLSAYFCFHLFHLIPQLVRTASASVLFPSMSTPSYFLHSSPLLSTPLHSSPLLSTPLQFFPACSTLPALHFPVLCATPRFAAPFKSLRHIPLTPPNFTYHAFNSNTHFPNFSLQILTALPQLRPTPSIPLPYFQSLLPRNVVLHVKNVRPLPSITFRVLSNYAKHFHHRALLCHKCSVTPSQQLTKIILKYPRSTRCSQPTTHPINQTILSMHSAASAVLAPIPRASTNPCFHRIEPRPHKSMPNYRQQLKASQYHRKPSETLGNHPKLSETIRNSRKPSETLGNYPKLSETVAHISKLSQTTQATQVDSNLSLIIAKYSKQPSTCTITHNHSQVTADSRQF